MPWWRRRRPKYFYIGNGGAAVDGTTQCSDGSRQLTGTCGWLEVSPIVRRSTVDQNAAANFVETLPPKGSGSTRCALDTCSASMARRTPEPFEEASHELAAAY